MLNQLETWTKQAARLQTRSEAARAAYASSQARLAEAKDRAASVEQARLIVQKVAQSIQEKAHAAIASVVSRCLATVFDEPYEFKILFELKRGRTEAVMVFERAGFQVDPMTASGGGTVDVAAFALRLSCLMLKRPKARRVVILDEPFKSPSPQYRERIKEMIETLAGEMGFQFIYVTNIMELTAGNVIDLEQIKAE